MADRDVDRTDLETLDLLRRVGIERDTLGARLARHEFEALCRELQDADALRLTIDIAPLDGAAGAGDIPPEPEHDLGEDLLESLPRLPVPLGRIAWTRQADTLPVTGIVVDRMAPEALGAALLPLLTEHHRAPFARLVFLCRTLDPVHLLGRYGFICHAIGDTDIAAVGAFLAHRYDMAQVRGLQDGGRLWP